MRAKNFGIFLNLFRLTSLLFIILLVFALGYYFGQRNSSSLIQAENKKLNSFCYEHSNHQKNKEQNIGESEEILGQVIKLFLINLGFKSNKDQIHFAEPSLSKEIEQNKGLNNSPQESFTDEGGTFNETHHPMKLETDAESIHSKTSTNLQKNEQSLQMAHSEQDISKLLQDLTFHHFYDILKNKKELDEEQLDHLKGTYQGDVIFDDPNEEKWEMKFSFSGKKRDNEKLFAKTRLTLSKKGKIFYQRRGNGEMDHVHSLSRESNAILLEANTGYFQLYLLSESLVLVGIYYQRQSIDSYQRAGSVTLFRK